MTSETSCELCGTMFYNHKRPKIHLIPAFKKHLFIYFLTKTVNKSLSRIAESKISSRNSYDWKYF